ncbi:MAG: response regulator [candidate division NC10 bacterium]|nr:response regulator [candidate division NC10 bacterium]
MPEPLGHYLERFKGISWWQRITAKVLIMVIFSTTLPLLSAGVLIIQSNRVRQEREIQTRNQDVAKRAVEKVESYIENILEDMSLLANTLDFRSMDFRRQEYILFSMIKYIYIKEMSVLDRGGWERLKLSEEKFFTPQDFKNQRTSPKFTQAIQGKIYVGPLYTSEFHEPMVTLAVPIRSVAGDRVTGVLAAEVNLKDLWEEVLSFKVGETSYIYVVDSEGRLIAHPDFSLVLAKKDFSPFKAVARFLEAKEEDNPSRPDEYPNYQGVRVLGVHSPSKKLGWGVIVEQPRAEAFAGIKQNMIEVITVLVMTLAATVLIGIYAAQRFTGPIKQLDRGARIVGSGNLDHVIQVQTADEIGQTAAAFNQMTENLKRLFEKVEEARKEWEATFDAISDCVSIHDQGFRILRANRAMVERFGTRPEDLVGRKCHQVFLGSEEVCPGCPQVITQEAKEAASEEVVDARRGTIYHVFTYPLTDRGGKLWASVHQAKDITQHKRLESQLFQSEKLAAIGTLASGIAHDFNNLLATISLRTQLLQRRIQDEELRSWLSIIERTAWDGVETVRRLREFTKSAPDESFMDVDLNQVAREVVQVTQARWKDEAESQGIKIDVQLDLGLTNPIEGRASELRDVLTNMIFNAIDAMPHGGTIIIKTWGNEDQAYISISDTGVGMTEEVKKRVFDPFFTTKGVKGTGLGLSVAYGIVSRHRGEILVDSQEGKGSTFTIRFPMERKARREVKREEERVSPTRPVRILVIEDEPALRDALRDIFTSLGHQVSLASEGNEGITLFRQEPFDLVLTDLGMPGMSGYDVAKRIRELRLEIPLILITGWGDQVDQARIREAGIDLVLAKPFKIEQVAKAMTQVLRWDLAGV